MNILTLTGCQTPQEMFAGEFAKADKKQITPSEIKAFQDRAKADRPKQIANGTIKLETGIIMAIGENDTNEVRRLVTRENVNTGCRNEWKLDTETSCLYRSIAELLTHKEQAEITKMLILEKNADVNIMISGYPPENRITPLLLLSKANSQQLEIFKLMIERGANVNFVDKGNGATALMNAARLGYTEIVKLLIEKGADITLKEKKNGRTALDLANEFERTETYEVLKAAAKKLPLK
jgi:hypothetical protein